MSSSILDRIAAPLVALLLVAVSPTAADWIVFVNGGIQETAGPLKVRGNQVTFYSRQGTLLSVRAEDVDLPTSAFISWQIGDLRGGRRAAPAPAPSAKGAAGPKGAATPCAPARVTRVIAAETLEVALAGKTEAVHAACLDAPETKHKFPQLAWYGSTAYGAVGGLVRVGDRVCLTEDTPPQRDKLGHRVVYVTLDNGRDLSAEVITRGFGLLHRAACGRGPAYQALETAARIAEQGHWGPAANEVAMFIVAQGATFGGGPPAIAAGGG
jgi:endonuclease YncB( thermonuclease family)